MADDRLAIPPLPTPGDRYDRQNETAFRREMQSLVHEFDSFVTRGPVSGLRDLAVNVKTFGAKGDGVTDDTAAIQATIDEAIDSTNAFGSESFGQGFVFLPPGSYKITSTLNFTGVWGFSFVGVGRRASRLIWGGNDAADFMFDLGDMREAYFADFYVQAQQIASAATLHSVFRIHNASGAVVTPSNNSFERLTLQGVDGGFKRGFFWDESGSGGDNNNDGNTLFKVQVWNYTEYAYHVTGTRSKTHTFLDCGFSGGINGVRSGGSYTWFGGAGLGGYTSGAAFFQTDVVDRIIVRDANLEGCDRLFEGPGATTGSFPLTLEGIRFATNNLNGDSKVVKLHHPGPFRLANCLFGPNSAVLVSLDYGGDEPGVHGSIVDNHFGGNQVTESPWDFKLGDKNIDLEIHGNTFDNGAGSVAAVGLITDGDTTPGVLGGRFFRTQNTSGTTITDFDLPHVWQRIVVLIEDANTTFQHGAGTLELQGAGNFVAGNGDVLELIHDGAKWLEVSRKT